MPPATDKEFLETHPRTQATSTFTQRVTGEESPEDEYMKAFAKGARLSAFERGLGHKLPGTEEKPAPQSAQQENQLVKYALDEASSAKKDIQRLTEKLADSARDKGQPPREDPFITFLSNRLEKIESALTSDQRKTQGSGVREFFDLLQTFKDNLGLSGPVGAKGDLAHMVEIKRLDIESSERTRQHESELAVQIRKIDIEMKERDHRWEVEREDLREQRRLEGLERERRWAQEDELRRAELSQKRAEFEAENANRDKAGGIVEDILGAIAEARGGGAAPTEEGVSLGQTIEAGAQMPSESGENVLIPYRVPKDFDCVDCGTKVPIPANVKPGDQVNCPSCKTTHVMDWKR